MLQLNRLRLLGLVVLLVTAGCEQTSAPVRRDILGSWQSSEIVGVEIDMTLAETARSIDGAGGWTEDGITRAFRVFGALARDEVSLYFDFEEGGDVSFQGRFIVEDRIQGELFGGASGVRTVTFLKARLDIQ